jgi:hypothetical protein
MENILPGKSVPSGAQNTGRPSQDDSPGLNIFVLVEMKQKK